MHYEKNLEIIENFCQLTLKSRNEISCVLKLVNDESCKSNHQKTQNYTKFLQGPMNLKFSDLGKFWTLEI